MSGVVKYVHIDASRPVWLPDGRDGQTLRHKELWSLLQGLPGLDATMGKQDLLSHMKRWSAEG